MRFKHAGRAHAAIAVAAAVALTAAASPAGAAQVHVGADQTVVIDHPRHGAAIAVERGTGQFRARYQLRLSEARRLLGR